MMRFRPAPSSSRTAQGAARDDENFQAVARPPGIAASTEGMAAVEFAVILPLLVVLWIGGVEITQALSVDRKVNNLAASVGDLAARSEMLTFYDVENIFDIADWAMHPYGGADAAIVLTAVTMDEDGAAKVAWSRTRGAAAHAENASMDDAIDEDLRIPDTQVIMAEVEYPYTPAIGYVVSGTVRLADRAFFVPRRAPRVQLCDTDGPGKRCD